MKEFLMYFVILGEAVWEVTSGLRAKMDIKIIGYILLLPIILTITTYMHTMFGIIVGVSFIIGGFMVALISLVEKEYSVASYFIYMVVLSFLYFIPLDTQILHQKKDVTLTEKNVKYKGYTESTSCAMKDCKSNLYTLSIRERTWFGAKDTSLIVSCKVVDKTQEVE